MRVALSYSTTKIMSSLPRIPVRATIDLTYRCNNNCRHCWVRLAPGAEEKRNELATQEIIAIVDQARQLGTREWSVSGGEPMLRPDFYEIFDYITAHSKTYSLNTNGTLITPKIARLLRERKGNKMIALYGATKKTYETVSRVPGSYEAAMRGFQRLQEAGAGFVVQIIPMKSNYHEYEQMVELAKSLSPHWRIGAPWLYLSACGNQQKNRDIDSERLPPHIAVELDTPDMAQDNGSAGFTCGMVKNDNMFESCINTRRDFYIDPYGRMTFCSYLREPALMYDLRQGSVAEGWERFIPSLKNFVKGGPEYAEHCGSCSSRADCRWCGVYGYLEHRRFSAPVEYLCQVAQETGNYKQEWRMNHVRYYSVAGLTLKVESDLPFTDSTFHPKFDAFRVNEPGDDVISIFHHFELPPLSDLQLSKLHYRKPPWAIYKNGTSWVYMGISPIESDDSIHRLVVFNEHHSRGRFYNRDSEIFERGDLHSLTLTASDQLMLAPVLANRQACYFHSSGLKYNEAGFVFLGHSDAGKSTMVKLMHDYAQVLCDERIIVRKWPDGFYIHGNWSHGEIPLVSPESAPLRALFFLQQSPENRIEPIGKADAIKRMIACLIKPFETKEWWEKELSLLQDIADSVPTYILHFNKSGGVRKILDSLV